MSPRDPEVRSITRDELGDYLRCTSTGFHGKRVVTDEHLAFFGDFWQPLDRRLAAFDGGSLAGTAGAFPTELTVPGGAEVPLCAVTAVTVLPTHRRRGLLTAMMRHQLSDAVARDEPVAMLIAAEWPIYGRFGYGMAIEAAATHLDASTVAFRDPDFAGSLEITDDRTFREVAPAVFDEHRRATPGSIGRSDRKWDLYTGVLVQPGEELSKALVRVVHRDQAGVADGYVVYEPKDVWVHNRPQVELQVLELMATNDHAYLDLWRYLAAVDWVTLVHAGIRPIDEALRHHLVNGRSTWQTDRSDHMWVRLLDVRRALEARTYDAEARAVVEVVDPFLDRGGRFALEVGPAGASCRRSRAKADAVVPVDVLGAAYLGGTRLWQLTHRIDERTAGTVAALDRSFATARAPWCTTNF